MVSARIMLWSTVPLPRVFSTFYPHASRRGCDAPGSGFPGGEKVYGAAARPLPPNPVSSIHHGNPMT